MVSLLVAISENNVIGKDNQLIWHLPEDLKFFKRVTLGHHIIMGRKTFESIGRVLPGRTSVIITRNKSYKAPEDCIVVNSLSEALEMAKNDEEAFVIGGGEIFKEAIPISDKVYLTIIHEHFEGDTFFPKLNLEEWKEVKNERHQPDEKNKYHYSFLEFVRK